MVGRTAKRPSHREDGEEDDDEEIEGIAVERDENGRWRMRVLFPASHILPLCVLSSSIRSLRVEACIVKGEIVMVEQRMKIARK